MVTLIGTLGFAPSAGAPTTIKERDAETMPLGAVNRGTTRVPLVMTSEAISRFGPDRAALLARAGCTTAEIAAITGHSLGSVTTILSKDLPRDTTVARNAQMKRGIITSANASRTKSWTRTWTVVGRISDSFR